MKLKHLFLYTLMASGCMHFLSCNQTESSADAATDTTITSTMNTVNATAPMATKKPHEITMHGDTRVDDYYWLNKREDQNVLDYLNAENDYTNAKLQHTKAFQEKLYDEIVGRIKKDDSTVPYKDNGYWYLTRFEEGKEYPIHGRKKGSLDAKEEIMLDVNKLAEGYAYYSANGMNVSPDNKLLAFGEDTLSRRIYKIRIKNLETGEYLKDEIPNCTGGSVWANDNKTLYYTVKDETLRAYKIFKHTLGTDPSKDKLIWHETDDTFSTFVYKTKSKQYLVIGSSHTLTTEYRILDANNPNGEFKIFEPRDKAGKHEYSIDHYKDEFYVRTNWDAENFRLMKTSTKATGKSNWKEVIPHRKEVLLEGMEIFKDYLVLSERKEGITQLRVKTWDGKNDHYIDFKEKAYLANVSVNRDFDTDILRLGYQSMSTPNSTFDYNMTSKQMTLLKQDEVLGGFDSKNYKTERIYATARDGVKVPMSIVYHKDTKIDGTAPCLLYAYGSYGASMDPYFSSVRLSLLDRGFVYVIAHIRGGMEMGKQWYEDGKKLKKKNTFTDYIDCGEHLVANKYAKKDMLFANGGSAGGLLMGAVANMRPDMWRGVVAAVPFVDVVTTMLDESIPLTTGEFDEWGNPKEEEYYHYMKSYSPYDNVEKKDYPNMLVTTGLHDSQVQYWEPAKWVAKMRDMKTDNNALLLRTNMSTGHGGASGRFERYKETAMDYAFILDLAGKVEVPN
jgi:oligopeptidase B